MLQTGNNNKYAFPCIFYIYRQRYKRKIIQTANHMWWGKRIVYRWCMHCLSYLLRFIRKIFAKKYAVNFDCFGRIFVVVVVVVGIAFVLTRPMLSWCFSYYVYFYAAPILLYACVLLLVFCYLFAHSIVLASFFFTLWLLLSRRCELSADEKNEYIFIFRLLCKTLISSY